MDGKILGIIEKRLYSNGSRLPTIRTAIAPDAAIFGYFRLK